MLDVAVSKIYGDAYAEKNKAKIAAKMKEVTSDDGFNHDGTLCFNSVKKDTINQLLLY